MAGLTDSDQAARPPPHPSPVARGRVPAQWAGGGATEAGRTRKQAIPKPARPPPHPSPVKRGRVPAQRAGGGATEAARTRKQAMPKPPRPPRHPSPVARERVPAQRAGGGATEAGRTRYSCTRVDPAMVPISRIAFLSAIRRRSRAAKSFRVSLSQS